MQSGTKEIRAIKRKPPVEREYRSTGGISNLQFLLSRRSWLRVWGRPTGNAARTAVWPSHAFVPLHHASPFRTAASAAILHEGLDLLELLRCEHTPRGEQRFHVLLLHLSAQGIHLIQLLHDRVMIRIIRAQQFTEFNVAQLHIRASLHGSFLRVYADLMQAPNLLIRETKVLAHAGILRHAQKVLAPTKSVPAAALPTTVSALSRPAEVTRAASLRIDAGPYPIRAARRHQIDAGPAQDRDLAEAHPEPK